MRTSTESKPGALVHRTARPLVAHRRALRRAGAAGVAAVLLAGLAACSSSGGSSSAGSTGSSAGSSAVGSSAPAAGSSAAGSSATTGTAGSITIYGMTVSPDASLIAALPASVKRTGALNDISYNNAPPDTFVKDGKLVGWEIDLGRAVAATLGLKWNPTASGAFDSFIPGLQNGRYNSSFTSFIQTPERLKQIDIVTYFNVGTGFAVKKGSSLRINDVTDLCGHSVAVLAGSAFIQQLQGVKCTAAGKSAIKVQSFPSDAAAELAVSSGRAEVYSSSANQLAYLVDQTNGQFEVSSVNYMPVPEGAGVTKGTGLSKSIGDAMDTLIASGVYKKIMNQWKITEGLVTKATVYTGS